MTCQAIRISMDGKVRASDNVIVERFFRTIKYDKLNLEPLETGALVQRASHEFIHDYNHKRDHRSLLKSISDGRVYKLAA